VFDPVHERNAAIKSLQIGAVMSPHPADTVAKVESCAVTDF